MCEPVDLVFGTFSLFSNQIHPFILELIILVLGSFAPDIFPFLNTSSEIKKLLKLSAYFSFSEMSFNQYFSYSFSAKLTELTVSSCDSLPGSLRISRSLE